MELEPGWDQLYFGLGQTLVQKQCHDEAIAALCTAAQKGPGNAFTEAALAYALGRAGRHGEAQRAMEQLTAKYAYVPHWFQSIVRIGLNDKERALESLESALRDHEACLVSLKVDPVFDPLRGERRFSEMVRRVGILVNIQRRFTAGRSLLLAWRSSASHTLAVLARSGTGSFEQREER